MLLCNRNRWTAETAIGIARLTSYPIEGGLDEFNYAIALWDALP
jgi:hypothetical protein